MKTLTRAGTVLAGALAILLLGAAQLPAALARTNGGLWELSGVPGASKAVRQCVADPALLAQYEHRQGRCERTVVRNQGAEAEIHYSCAGGGFGRTKIDVLTPRSLRVETQGISDNAPFHYVFQARRVGNCATH